MGTIIMFLIYALGALAIAAMILTGRGVIWIVMEIIRFVRHEFLMRPQQRYYMFR